MAAASAVLAQAEGPSYPSPEWALREADNYAHTLEAPAQQAADPAFLSRWQEQSLDNFLEYQLRRVEDPDWNSSGNLCATWGEQCTGDPYRYPGVDPFYDDEGVVMPVAFIDSGGARLSGRVWVPMAAEPGAELPGVVIENGSVQAPETLYWWAAQALVRSGYVVLTYDPRGQGRSDNATTDGEAGSNINPEVFVTNLVDAVDFLLSTPSQPYAGNIGDARATTPHNPLWDRLDPDRIGIAGHSLGAAGVSVVQGLEPWPGTSGTINPVRVAVAWDNLSGLAPVPAGYEVIPRVPAMGQAGEYGLTPTPFTEPPDPDAKRHGYLAWVEAGVPSFQLAIRGSTHYEWSLLPTFPTTAWEPGGPGGWGRPLAEHYTLAWFDRWLKQPGEPGFADADARLLTDDDWCERLSFYFVSSRSFPGRDGTDHETDDLLTSCLTAAGAPPSPAPAPEVEPGSRRDTPSLPATGGFPAAVGLLLALAAHRRIGRVGRPR